MPKLKAPEGVTGCSHNDEEFVVVDGIVEVPAEAVADFLHHGFEPAPAEEKPAKKVK